MHLVGFDEHAEIPVSRVPATTEGSCSTEWYHTDAAALAAGCSFLAGSPISALEVRVSSRSHSVRRRPRPFNAMRGAPPAAVGRAARSERYQMMPKMRAAVLAGRRRLRELQCRAVKPAARSCAGFKISNERCLLVRVAHALGRVQRDSLTVRNHRSVQSVAY